MFCVKASPTQCQFFLYSVVGGENELKIFQNT
jgi:hypothetical protein